MVRNSPESAGSPKNRAAGKLPAMMAAGLPSREMGKNADLEEIGRQLALAQDIDQAMSIASLAARKLTGADGAAIVLREGSESVYAAEDSIHPLWVGQRLPSNDCISGWVMNSRTPVCILDIYQDPRIQFDRYRPTYVRSLSMVPIRTYDPLGAIGNYWATPHHSTQEDMRILQAIADATAVSLERIRMQRKLEILVRRRTEELEAANQELRMQAQLRQQMESRIIHLSLTDELTSLNNRRGFLLRAHQLLKLTDRLQTYGWIIYIDIDNLKQINDQFGHEAGDRLIRGTAHVLLQTFRDSDVIGRIGGDEFVVFAAGSTSPLHEIEARLHHNVQDHNARFSQEPPISFSMGIVRCDGSSQHTLEERIHQADTAMYHDKRKKRSQRRHYRQDRYAD